ncbi:MAG: hypothetical protein FRX49_09265 [Trebouxia sp. A1-2]|nr:MAG: hypothetical protein FRX49_09265 [Trebouxia sp. A1-2]
MHETCSSFCEEEADFLTELLVKQEAASQPIHLFPDDGAESSGTQAAMSDVSTTFGDWEADGVVPNLTCASSMLSSLQVPVKPTSLMLQLDYSDVIRAKKTTRQSGSSKIRYQIRKTNADNRLRFKGCFVKPSKLAELQMEAALNTECQDASSPMISGGSSESIFS